MHATRNDLPEPARKKLCELLNARLADTIDLALQTRQAHWNVKGPQFIALHKLFDEVYETVNEKVDEVAERIAALGGSPEGTLQALAKRSTLATWPLLGKKDQGGRAHVMALADVLAAYGKQVREAIGAADELQDADSADLFTEISREIDKKLWFVEAHVQAET